MDVGLAGHVFGSPCSWAAARWIVLPVPWAVTCSFRDGAAQAPEAILKASSQIDTALADLQVPEQLPIHMEAIPERWLQTHATLRPQVQAYLETLARSPEATAPAALIAEVDTKSEALRAWVRQKVETILNAGKHPAILGGEHSVIEGGVHALLNRYPHLGILHIDAHMDLRQAYTGFRHSHASVMYNLLEDSPLSCLVQVGIREFSTAEQAYALAQRDRVYPFYADYLHKARFTGRSWHALVTEIIARLPHEVYISLDIDGLAPAYCPHTGTPAAGGLSFAEVVYLLQRIAAEGKRVVGFDLVEVVPDPAGLDQILAAQLLYRLCMYAGLF